MHKLFDPIVALLKRADSYTDRSYGFDVTFNLQQEDLNLLSTLSSVTTESYYTSDKKSVDLDSPKINEDVCFKINTGTLRIFLTKAKFIAYNKYKEDTSKYYIHDNQHKNIDFITSYQSNLKIINFLKQLADYEKIISGELELFFYKSELGVVVKANYNETIFNLKLNEIATSLTELEEHFFSKTDKNERKQIFVNELINTLSNNNNTYVSILENWQSIIDNYKKSFSLYLTGFSFSKVKSATTEHFSELTEKLYSTLLKNSSYIYAIPFGYILTIRFFDYDGESLAKDSVLFSIGLLYYCLMQFVLFENIKDAIIAIENDINRFKNNLGTDESLQPIIEELNIQVNDIVPKQKRKLMLARHFITLVFILTAIAFCSIYLHWPEGGIMDDIYDFFLKVTKLYNAK